MMKLKSRGYHYVFPLKETVVQAKSKKLPEISKHVNSDSILKDFKKDGFRHHERANAS